MIGHSPNPLSFRLEDGWSPGPLHLDPNGSPPQQGQGIPQPSLMDFLRSDACSPPAIQFEETHGNRTRRPIAKSLLASRLPRRHEASGGPVAQKSYFATSVSVHSTRDHFSKHPHWRIRSINHCDDLRELFRQCSSAKMFHCRQSVLLVSARKHTRTGAPLCTFIDVAVKVSQSSGPAGAPSSLLCQPMTYLSTQNPAHSAQTCMLHSLRYSLEECAAATNAHDHAAMKKAFELMHWS